MNIEETQTGLSLALERRVRRHAALADPTRLRLVDLLALGDCTVSELGADLGMPSNLLAHHLNVLESASVVRRHRSEGDARRTYVCLAREEQARAGSTDPLLTGVDRVVFVCTANTARSHLAAALWRSASEVAVLSAGTHPGERVAPGALAAAQRHGLDLPDVAPQQVAGLLEAGDLVVTVCDRAHEEAAGRLHWSVPDPVPTGTDAAFDAAFDLLAARVGALAEVVPVTRPA